MKYVVSILVILKEKRNVFLRRGMLLRIVKTSQIKLFFLNRDGGDK
jgi:hypothetical protein